MAMRSTSEGPAGDYDPRYRPPFRMPYQDEAALERLRERFRAGEVLSAAETERYERSVATGEVFAWQHRRAEHAARERQGRFDFMILLRARAREARADKPRKVIR